MKITLAKSAGFCFGVDRAVMKVYELLDAGKKVCTLGPIIHNPQFIAYLEGRGVLMVEDPGDVPEGYVLLIRTHGVPEEVIEKAKSLGLDFCDMTCPFVRKIQKIVEKHSAKENLVLLAGDENHPEVVGIRSYCKGESFVFNNAEELRAFFEKNPESKNKEVVLAAQTTFSVEEFEKCLKIVKMLYTNPQIFDTICNATAERQEEARLLSATHDCMVVVGGRTSSNTDKLRGVCARNCRTYLVEKAEELLSLDFSGCGKVGITAGASTPDSIIKEVRNTMSDIIKENENAAVEEAAAEQEINFDELSFEEALEESLKSMTSDQKVKGTVVRILPTEIQVDIGRKQTGYIPYDEYSADPDADPAAELKVGDELELMIMKTNDMEGTVMLSKRRLDASKYWDDIITAEKEQTVLEGKVVEVINKGVLVFSKGVRVFIPASLATASRNERLEDLLNQSVRFVIIDVDRKRRRAVGSIRAVLKTERKEAEDKFWSSIEEGAKYTGKVVSLTDFGAFVDLGGAHGLVHRSELSWKRIKHPSDIVSVGDEVEVFVKSVDREKKKISLGYKKTEDNPWEVLRRDYPVGSVVEVKIAGLTAFGAFGSIIPGVDGLIHISQISDKRIAQPQDAISLGETVKAKIIDIDFEKKRVSLSIKALLEPEKAEEPAEAAEKGDEPVAVSIDELLAKAEAEQAAEEDA
ncbi:MAG: bifunctional 4-hydroxy-3-methylbut-2-enyl diphosphate reductase/30S ribosomal protein S1 [Oscillospiraceae bacterium]|nr:bifunctional 4-hydroxy-3-methylbut-2-enyl diphosphate reductase/30S ribosomal protein S1 [Oscillospiraceae bacterium]